MEEIPADGEAALVETATVGQPSAQDALRRGLAEGILARDTPDQVEVGRAEIGVVAGIATGKRQTDPLRENDQPGKASALSGCRDPLVEFRGEPFRPSACTLGIECRASLDPEPHLQQGGIGEGERGRDRRALGPQEGRKGQEYGMHAKGSLVLADWDLQNLF
jgi:hypothetical protein